MKDYEQFVVIGGIGLVLPYIHPFLKLVSEYATLISPIGLVALLIGLILMFTTDS